MIPRVGFRNARGFVSIFGRRRGGLWIIVCAAPLSMLGTGAAFHRRETATRIPRSLSAVAVAAWSRDAFFVPDDGSRENMFRFETNALDRVGDAAVATVLSVPDDGHQRIAVRDVSALVEHGAERDERENVAASASPKPLAFQRDAFDMSSPREWMEYLEASYHHRRRRRGGGGGGAYTVLRCEGTASSSDDGGEGDGFNVGVRWSVGGAEFHLGRLRESFRALLEATGDDDAVAAGTTTTTTTTTDESFLRRAENKSVALVRALLTEAERCFFDEQATGRARDDDDDDDERPTKLVVMTTLLWTPEEQTKASGSVNVRAHARVVDASSSTTAEPPTPTNVMLATPPKSTRRRAPNQSREERANDDDHDDHSLLPRRYDRSPSAKLSSWCRARKPLEDARRFKPSGVVGEVLLVRPAPRQQDDDDDDEQQQQQRRRYRILEGLTSNFFAVFADGTLRTCRADDGVLNGHVRDLILRQFATRATGDDDDDGGSFCGLTLDPRPLIVGDDWEHCVEAFVTSSVRLVVPVQKMYAPTTTTARDESDEEPSRYDYEEVWRAAETSSTPWKEPRWMAIHRFVQQHVADELM